MFRGCRLPMSFLKERSNPYYEKGNEMFTEDGIKIYKIYVPHAGRITSVALEKYFKKFGEIEKVEIVNPNNSDSGFKFCFIEYTKAEDAKKALDRKVHYISNRKYVISPANSWHQPVKKSDSENHPEEITSDADLPILTLNDDCLLKVFSYLPIKEQLILSKMSPRFQEILELNFKINYKCLTIHQFDKMTLLNWRELLQTCGQYIKSVVNSHDLSTDKAFDLIINYSPNLESLKLISITKFLPGTFQKMCKKTPKLKSIEIYDCKLNDKLISEMTRLKELIDLKISESFHITGMYFQNFKNLIHLDINQCLNIQSKYFIDFLKVAGNLESLNIVRCSRFNNDVFNEIPKYCKSLKTLKIGTTYSGWNLQKVAEIENLENLTIQHTDVYLKEEIIKDLSVKKADQMKEFHLILSKFQKSNETDLNNVLKFKNLENLTLQGFKDMKNEFLVQLVKTFSHSLRGISLAYNTELTQAGILKFIEACPLLTQIDLTHCILGTDFSEELFKLLKARRERQNYEAQQKPFRLELSMEQYRQSEFEHLDKSILEISFNYQLSHMQMMMEGDDSFDEDDDEDDDDDLDFMESDDEGLFNMMINAMFDSDDDFMWRHHAYGGGDYDDFSDDDMFGGYF